jgi:cell division protein FtsQ
MQSLRAPERPVSHFRGARSKAEPAPAGRERGQAEPVADDWTEEPRESRLPQMAQILRRPVAALPSRGEARPAAADRRDPAPSRLSYRMERLWLTPFFRVLMRVGLPVVLLAGAVGLYLGDQDRRAALMGQFADLRAQIENRPEFMVTLMAIDGASQPVADAVRGMVTVPLPASSFQLDLEAMRAAIEQIDAVESVRLMVRSGGVLAVEITERKPAVLWRTEASVEMLDKTGHRVATLLDRTTRPDLPLITGVGAEDHVPEALAILAAAQPILPRVRGLVLLGDRRWDVVLDRDQRIMLPETDPVQAVEKAMAIDTAEEMLARDLAVVDLRNPDRPTLRLTAQAVEASRAITETVTKVAGE